MRANPHKKHPNRSRGSLSSVMLTLVLPIAVVVGLVATAYVKTNPTEPKGRLDNSEQGVASRIQKVGSVAIREANKALRSGEDVYKAQCSACHAAGTVGAPKFADAGAWGPRIGAGFDALLQSALKGKGAMGAQGGGEFNDIEIGRAVAYMANAGGAKFAIPGPAAGAEASKP
ncbi:MULTISPECIES: c-type cytochrome [Giesbergeria]|uniref:C-type cytochrome n=1 Tax=Giesbergeria sinuosa TaxID=80883 RepID=A0ABV9Q9E8_9BURK